MEKMPIFGVRLVLQKLEYVFFYFLGLMAKFLPKVNFFYFHITKRKEF